MGGKQHVAGVWLRRRWSTRLGPDCGGWARRSNGCFEWSEIDCVSPVNKPHVDNRDSISLWH